MIPIKKKKKKKKKKTLMVMRMSSLQSRITQAKA